jgi:hypothetical protein
MKLNELFVVVYKSNPTWLISDTVFASREEADVFSSIQPAWRVLHDLPEREVSTLAAYIERAYRDGYDSGHREGYADGYPAAF